MATSSKLERAAVTLALFAVALIFSGTKACQEDYELGTQTTLKNTPTATGTADDNDDDTATRTPTSTATSGPSVATATPTVTATPTTRAVIPAQAGGGLFQELSALSDNSADEKAAAVASGNKRASAQDGNWLGAGLAGKAADASGWQDSDGDGFSDEVETHWSSDENDPVAVPMNLLSTNVQSRLSVSDSDSDGLSTDDERTRGTNPRSLDSDGDGRPDGAEVLSGGDPLDDQNRYLDRDGDSLSDEYEQGAGFKVDSMDSDGDGLRDDLELVVGSSPIKIDSDGDGVSDGREYDAGSDPTVADGTN
jgi:hypothetical protein